MAKRSREDSPPPSDTDSTTLPSSPSGLETGTPLDGSHSTKYLQISDQPAERPIAMKCSLAPHPETLTFTTFEDFEVHYAQVHTNRCSECHKNFPTAHFLNLHISENHDPLVAARRGRDEKTYRCFVEDCDKICSTPQKRRMHLQAKHYFPKDYDFFIVNDGIDKRSSMLRQRHRRRSSAASRALHRGQKPSGLSNGDTTSSLKEIAQDDVQPTLSRESWEKNSLGMSPALRSGEMDDLTSTMSALKFVPPSVRFGRGGPAAGLGRQ